jgi:hypothetical protein
MGRQGGPNRLFCFSWVFYIRINNTDVITKEKFPPQKMGKNRFD